VRFVILNKQPGLIVELTEIRPYLHLNGKVVFHPEAESVAAVPFESVPGTLPEIAVQRGFEPQRIAIQTVYRRLINPDATFSGN
jgi:hypothetical protein